MSLVLITAYYLVSTNIYCPAFNGNFNNAIKTYSIDPMCKDLPKVPNNYINSYIKEEVKLPKLSNTSNPKGKGHIPEYKEVN